jgi:hypothetical protein
VTQKCGIKDVGKNLVAPVQSERGTERSRRRDSEQRRSCTGDKFVRPAPKRVELPARQPICSCRAPDMLAAVFFPARIGVWHAIGISDVVLIEADRIHALGNETATIGIDKPGHAVTFANVKETASAETIVGDSTPFGSLQSSTQRSGYNCLFIAPAAEKLLICLKIVSSPAGLVTISHFACAER